MNHDQKLIHICFDAPNLVYTVSSHLNKTHGQEHVPFPVNLRVGRQSLLNVPACHFKIKLSLSHTYPTPTSEHLSCIYLCSRDEDVLILSTLLYNK